MASDDRNSPKIGVPSSPYLVYTSAGHRSNIKKWVTGKKNFDLWVTQYEGESDYHRSVADFYNERKGGKYPNLHDIYNRWGELLTPYRAIFVLDDDIELSASQISQLFRILERYKLVLLQPGFLSVGKISHEVTKANHFRFARLTNFVENCVPLFSKPILDRFMATYDPGLIAFGTDWWYLHLLTDEERETGVAVIDSVPCVNPDEWLEQKPRKIDQVEPVNKGIEIWQEFKRERGIEMPPGGVRSLGLLSPTALEDWLTLISAPLIRCKTFLFYPHYFMRLKRFYWDIHRQKIF